VNKKGKTQRRGKEGQEVAVAEDGGTREGCFKHVVGGAVGGKNDDRGELTWRQCFTGLLCEKRGHFGEGTGCRSILQ